MKKEILDSLPYDAIQGLIALRDYITKISSDHADLITKRENKDDSIFCEFIENVSKYAFVVRDFKYDAASGKNLYDIYRRPESIGNVLGASSYGELANIDMLFTKWIDDCQKMNKIKFEFLNPNSKFYDDEFADFFSNEDEDASENPFELDRQEILYYFLTYAEKQVNNTDTLEDEQRIELLNDLKTLKEDIPNKTKKVFVYHLSKFAQKTKKISNKLFHDVFDVLKKEIIKKVLYEGAAQIPNAVSKIEHWIHLLNN